MDGLHQFSKLYKTQTKAGNQIPQIMAVVGQCGGGMSISAELADFIFLEEEKGSIFVNPQGVVDNAIGNNPYVAGVNNGTYTWEEISGKQVILPLILSKGLEVDAVILYRCMDRLRNTESFERKMYLACTRALHELYLIDTDIKSI
jgi:hypothetical protein